MLIAQVSILKNTNIRVAGILFSHGRGAGLRSARGEGKELGVGCGGNSHAEAHHAPELY